MKKIAVIGGGPAGLYAAIEGAKNQLDVTLYERKCIGEDIHCAEGFFDSLNQLGQPEYGVCSKVEDIVVQLDATYYYSCKDKLNIWMIDRSTWQKNLSKKAQSLGVKILENTPIDISHLKHMKNQYDFILDGSGALSITSRAYGFYQEAVNNCAIAAQYKLKGDFKSLYGHIKIGFLKNLKGYYWIFPKAVDSANVGIIDFEKKHYNLWKVLDHVLQKENLCHSIKISKKGGLCPMEPIDSLIYNNILLIGDAACLTSSLHGGGIDTACLSAKLAIKSIVDENFSYEKQVNKELIKKLQADKVLYHWWTHLDYSDFEEIIQLFCTDHKWKMGLKDLLTGTSKILKNLKSIKNAQALYTLKHLL